MDKQAQKAEKAECRQPPKKADPDPLCQQNRHHRKQIKHGVGVGNFRPRIVGRPNADPILAEKDDGKTDLGGADRRKPRRWQIIRRSDIQQDEHRVQRIEDGVGRSAGRR